MTSVAKGRRRPRASFERTLARIIQKIEQSAVHEVSWQTDFPCRVMARKTLMKVKSLWAAGSFARGAATCGDLDLVMDVECLEGYVPPSRTIVSRIVGRFPDVVTYLGTPEENSSNVGFPEAVLIWSRESPDWEAALGRIQVDAAAGRFDRPHNVLPLRPEQFEYDDLEELLALREQKIIAWEWVPIDVVEAVCGRIEDDPATQHFCRRLERSGRGKKSLDALRVAVTWFSAHTSPWSWDSVNGDNTWIRMGGFDIMTGPHPYVCVHSLDSISCAGVAIISHISRRGPNGIWIIRRGAEHSLEKKFATLQGHLLVDDFGQPKIRNRQGAWWEIGVAFSRSPSKRVHAPTRAVTGGNLLSLLASVSWLTIGRKELKIHPLQHDCENEQAVIAEFRKGK